MYHRYWKWVCLLFTAYTLTQATFAAPPANPSHSPAGLWKAYDLDGVARSIIQFSVSGNKANARIVKLLPTKGQKPTDVCDQCPGQWKNKPKVGMQIVWGLTRQNDGKWSNGRVLDTDTGKIYPCYLTISPDNRVMHFHAYVGIPLFGGTVNWVRVK